MKEDKKEKKEEVTNLDKAQKKNTIVDIKKSNVLIIVFGIFFLLIFFLFRMGNNTSKQEKETVKIEPKKNIISKKDEFKITDYSNFVKKQKEVKEYTDLNEINEQTDEEIVRNELLENYYDQKLSEEIAAQTGVISFGTENTKGISTKESGIINTPTLEIPPYIEKEEDFNGQKEKKKFVDDPSRKKMYNSSYLVDKISKYEVKAGGIIPGVMLTGINSDLPGTMTANIREDVYDTVTGKHLLLPKGARIIGKYSSSVTFGQSRLLVVWQRIIFPNGKSLNLDNFEGVDMTGYSGLVGKVDNHTLRLFQGVVLSSVLGAAAGITDSNSNDENNWRHDAGQGAGEQIIRIGDVIANKLLKVQPTIIIKPGSRFNIIVNSDLILEPYQN